MTASDAHASVVVPEPLRQADPGAAWRPTVRRIAGRQVVELDGRRISSAEADLLHGNAERQRRRVPAAGAARG